MNLPFWLQLLINGTEEGSIEWVRDENVKGAYRVKGRSPIYVFEDDPGIIFRGSDNEHFHEDEAAGLFQRLLAAIRESVSREELKDVRR